MPFEKFMQECKYLLYEFDEDVKLETPPAEINADLSYPCFSLAKQQKNNPNKIATELEEKIRAKIKKGSLVKDVRAMGPYLNFYVNNEKFSEMLVKDVLKFGKKYGKGGKQKEKIMIEYVAPNTNKPLHLGHIRNMLLGESLARIFEFLGCKVIRVNLNNDRGVHICKAMLAYKLWGKNKTPKSEHKKSDHFVGDFYVLYSKNVAANPELESEIRIMLKKWEDGDKKTRKLWKIMNKWALDGFEETYKKFGIKFDEVFNESEHYKEGKNIIINGLKDDIFEKDENGNIIAKLEQFGLPNKVLLRADGTSVYMTQDINLAKLKYEKYKMDRSIYVVGSEQTLHFKQLFKILQLLKFKNALGLYHLAYGMVYLPEGRMKSREGRVVDADNLLDELIGLSKAELKKRYKLSKSEFEKRAKAIAIGALFYFILKFDSLKDFIYNPEESLSFEGDTGPYLQYTYARANSILKKSKKKPKIGKLTEENEFKIAKKLSQFSETIKRAAHDYKPHYVANYLFELATLFNEYYHATRVISSENEPARLALVKSVMIVLENGLRLLGIEAPKEM